MAKSNQSTKPTFVPFSGDPDDVGPSRPDNFDATVSFIYKVRKSKKGMNHYNVMEGIFNINGEEYREDIPAGFITSQDYNTKEIGFAWAPSPDGESLAGPEDVTIEDYIALGTGVTADGEILEEQEDLELYSGPFLVSTGSTMPATNATELLGSIKKTLIEQGKLEKNEKLSPRCDQFDGWKMHFMRLPPEKMKPRKQKEGEAPSNFPNTVLMCTDILEIPSAKKSATSATSAAGKSTAKSTATSNKKSTATAPEANGDFESDLIDRVMSTLSENDGPIPKYKLQAGVLSSYKNEGNTEGQAEAFKWFKNEDWFKDSERPWEVKGIQVSVRA